jgi:predicted component of type VI protein secretion system
MIQLKILNGKMAGTSKVARRFPVRVGRSASADLQIEEPGVWDEHVEIALDRKEGFALTAQPSALTSINGTAVHHSLLRNGDVIELGSAKIQFWLSDAPQRGLKIREAFVWSIILAATLAQLALIYWLVQ